MFVAVVGEWARRRREGMVLGGLVDLGGAGFIVSVVVEVEDTIEVS